jgi:hypothetical protein
MLLQKTGAARAEDAHSGIHREPLCPQVRRACSLIKQMRSVQYHRSVKDRRNDLRGRMHEIARTRLRYGYRRINVLLEHDGWQLGSRNTPAIRALRTPTTNCQSDPRVPSGSIGAYVREHRS